ncbi:PPR repeat [Musa troglodytarum]|uniref:PPR repeat n=1 Tax=Musa troglodytarum TaxID=320322 RepID=A0A9E7KCV9_9LILI|nr:PPR repeat [Musa troglodytarum]
MITASPTGSLVPHLHAVAIRTGFSCNFIVGTALVGAYAGRKDRIAVRRAFDDIPIKNLVSWTSLIVGYMQLGRLKEAEGAFGEMLAKNVVSWTVMINGFIDRARAARRCSKLVRRNAPAQRYPPQPVHVLCRACYLCRLLLPPVRQICPWANPEMQGAMGCDLVQLPRRDVWQMWRRGFCHPILRVISSPQLQEFERMIREGVRPDHITFVGALMACVHGGLVKEGWIYLGVQVKSTRQRSLSEVCRSGQARLCGGHCLVHTDCTRAWSTAWLRPSRCTSWRSTTQPSTRCC